MKAQRYFIQPNDNAIDFPLPTNLEEIKILYHCLAECSDRDYQAGHIVRSQEVLLQKLAGLIHYLQSEHYSHPD
jgi:hypothetical protein